MVKRSEKLNLFLLSFVAIVAIVGIVVLILNSDGSSSWSDTDLSGQAVFKTTTKLKEILKPDLVIKELSHSPSSAVIGDTVTFSVVVENQGVATAGGSVLIFRLGGETFGEQYLIPELAPGETYTLEREYDFERALNYENTIFVDIYNDVTESDETNNVEKYYYTIEES